LREFNFAEVGFCPLISPSEHREIPQNPRLRVFGMGLTSEFRLKAIVAAPTEFLAAIGCQLPRGMA
jgi:hypothetical protein